MDDLRYKKPFKKTEEPSNRKQQQQHKEAYKLKCIQRSLEYMQQPGNKQKATEFSKYGFSAATKQVEQVKPDYQAIFDCLSDMDDSQFEPTVVTFDENRSSNDPKIATLLRQTGLF
jgi:hypothetical protein